MCAKPSKNKEMEKTRVIEGRTSLIKLTIVHEGARVQVYQPWELEQRKRGVLKSFKALLGIK